MVRRAGHQTVLLKAHEHLTEAQEGIVKARKAGRFGHDGKKSYLYCPRVSDQVARQLQSPDVWDLHHLLCRRTGLFVWPAEIPHPEEP